MAYDGFSNEDYRVGGPYICSIPVITYDIPEHHVLYSRLVLDNDDLYHSIHSILSSMRLAASETATSISWALLRVRLVIFPEQ